MSSRESNSYTEKALAKIERRRRLEVKAENGALKAVHWLFGPKDKEKWVGRGKLAVVATGAYLAVNSCVAIVTNGAESEFPGGSKPADGHSKLVDIHIDGNTGPTSYEEGSTGVFSLRTSPDIRVTFGNTCQGYSSVGEMDLTLPREDVRTVKGDEVASEFNNNVVVDSYLAFRVPAEGLPSGGLVNRTMNGIGNLLLPGLPSCGPGDIVYVSGFNNIDVTTHHE